MEDRILAAKTEDERGELVDMSISILESFFVILREEKTSMIL